MANEKVIFACTECGGEHAKWAGRCKHCGSWNTLTEVKTFDTKNKNAHASHSWTGSKSKTIKFKDVNPTLDSERIKTGLGEFDRVLGGGIVPSTAILLSGDPGAGKSTILMQTACNVSKSKKVLYISGEEKIEALKNRALRLKLEVDDDNFYVIGENNLEILLEEINQIKPDLVIIDSIQTMFSSIVNSTLGSVSQIMACASAFNIQAKQLGHALIIIGHVTKDGSIAGPKVFAHMVDATLKFEVEGNSSYRSITAEKNRFGKTETGFFEMTTTGLVSVDNPSNIFLPDNMDYENFSGNSVYIMNKGSRSLLVEIQSLVDEKTYNNSKRIVSGLDLNRLHMILALLSKYENIEGFQDFDVYCSILGGTVAKEPDVDLSIYLSIISSISQITLPRTLASFGEISLAGEVRGVSMAEMRVEEAAKLGFKDFIIPFYNKNKSLEEMGKKYNIKIHYIKHVKQISEVLDSIIKDLI
jgi:DNA repair protein radA